ncbi:MAG: two-component system cell cycle sensor histidine kinase/response regulator CckA [Desulforhopalus sp.]|jgi:two-component system cell cycle sensor histidine kinase/response regulator CckA
MKTNREFISMKYRSISTELTISLVVLVFLVQGILLFLMYTRQSDYLYKQLLSKADEYALNLSETLSVPIWDYDDEQIKQIAQGFARNELFTSILVSNKKGKVLYEFHRESSPKQIVRESKILHIGNEIGRARFSLSLDTFTNDLIWLRNIAIVVLAVSLLVIVLATGLILRVLIRKPLTIFSQGMEKVAQGDHSYRFDEVRHRELVGIAQGFSAMADKVWERQQSLQKEVAERKRAEDRMRESEARTHAILDAIPDMLFQFDNSGRFVELRGTAEDFTIPTEECIGKTIEQVMPEDISREFRKQLTKTFETRGVRVFEYYLPFKDAFLYYECRLVAVSDDLALGMVRNITERVTAAEEKKRLLEQLQRAQKMESLGLLAGGVAHDLNNILSGVVSYPELILMELSSENKLRRPIEIMYQSGQRATAIVQDLLTVARGVAIAKESINVNAIVQDYLLSPDFQTLQQYHKDILIEVDLAEDLLPIKGSQVHVRKILMNLISNGCEAIETSGNVLIRTASTYVDSPFRGYDDVEQGEYVVLSIVDKGGGISEDDLGRIFEPFYSKKVMGRSGTGLGLAVVWNVVQDHSGYIDVISNDQGTSFNVYLPVTRQRVTKPEKALEITEISGDGQSILVIDDAESQRYITTSILNKLGYKTESVASGEEAISFLENRSMDLIVLDMIMDPGMNGRQTYEDILHLTPNQKAVIVSGFTETEEVKKTLMMGAHCYLKKPLKIQDLGIAVRQALQSK